MDNAYPHRLCGYAPDPEATPPVSYHRLGEPALPVVAWQPRQHRPGRAIQAVRLALAITLVGFAIQQILGALA